METWQFVVLAGVVFVAHAGLMQLAHVLSRAALDSPEVFHSRQDARDLRPLAFCGSGIFSLAISFLFAEMASHGEGMALLRGLGVGVLIGMLIYGAPLLFNLAAFRFGRRYFTIQALVGIAVCGLAGVLFSLLIS